MHGVGYDVPGLVGDGDKLVGETQQLAILNKSISRVSQYVIKLYQLGFPEKTGHV